MNILLINHYAGSDKMGMEFRPYYLAREWVKDGHKVTIVGATYSHLRKIQPLKTGAESIDGINYFWLWANKYKGNGALRLLSMIVFISQLLVCSLFFAWFKKPDVVIASSTYPLDIFPSWAIARISGAKLVFEIHDLWPMSPMELGKMSKTHPFIMLMRAGEWFAYKFSDHIISMLPGAYKHLEKDGVSKEKITYVPNGIIESTLEVEEIPESLQKILSKLKKEKKFIIGYAGSIGAANPLNTIMAALKDLKNENVAMVVVGGGPELAVVKEESKKLKNIYFHDKISKKEVSQFLDKVSAAYIEFSDSPLYQFGVSANKIFDYMLASKPIIQVLDSPYDLIKEANCGITIRPKEKNELVEAIHKLLAISPEKLTNMGKNGRSYALQRHNYQHLAREFLREICKKKQ